MALYDFFKERESAGKPLVLVTVFETDGSTYSKAGGQMVIDSHGDFYGMLSGGCLEGDLVERSRNVIETGEAQIASYDLGADDELWGLGVGCDGRLRVLLQPLSAGNGYQPFAAIADVLNGGAPAVVATVIESESLRPGDSALIRGEFSEGFGLEDETADLLARAAAGVTSPELRIVDLPGGNCRTLFYPLLSAPAVLILGAGLDSEPVARFAAELGWRCTVVDHRPAYIDARNYPRHTHSLCVPAEELPAHVNLDAYDMAIVMSHHLASDLVYLTRLAHSEIGYVGLLGPPGRRDRLLADLDDVANALHGRLHGPAGIILGGRGPGPIALEIVAEMQQYLAERGQVSGGVDVRRSGLE